MSTPLVGAETSERPVSKPLVGAETSELAVSKPLVGGGQLTAGRTPIGRKEGTAGGRKDAKIRKWRWQEFDCCCFRLD